MLRVAVFDFDGPISDTREAVLDLIRKAAASDEVPKITAAWQYLNLRGPERLVEDLGFWVENGLTPGTQETILQFLRASISTGLTQRASKQTGIELLIECARTLGYKTAILSLRTEAEIREFLDRHRIGHLIDHVVGNDSLSGIKKPNPRTLIETLARFSTKSPGTFDLLYVGDSDVDYATFCSVKQEVTLSGQWTYYHASYAKEPAPSAQSNADYTIDSLKPLQAIERRVQPLNLPSSDESLFRTTLDPMLKRRFSILCGAGVSIPSGYGDWLQQYRPILDETGVSPFISELGVLDAVTLGATDQENLKGIRNFFSSSFRDGKRPNAYHSLILRLMPFSIWTTNYDFMFEKAIETCPQELYRIVRQPSDLSLTAGTAGDIFKLHGDFLAGVDADLATGTPTVFEPQMSNYPMRRGAILDRLKADYRAGPFLFLGLSFGDPFIRTLIASEALEPSSDQPHLFLDVYKPDPLGRYLQSLQAERLKKLGIMTQYVRSYSQLMHVLLRGVMSVQRPIVGFAGNSFEDDGRGAKRALGGHSPVAKDIAVRCAEGLAKRLASQSFRVSSCCGPTVGREAVEAAYSIDPLSGRFVLREGGGGRYINVNAPIVRIKAREHDDLWREFVQMTAALIAIGGEGYEPTTGPSNLEGTVQEVRAAAIAGKPVIVVPQAGGHAESISDRFREEILDLYSDSDFGRRVGELNEWIRGLPKNLSEADITDIADRCVLLIQDYYCRGTEGEDPRVCPVKW